MDAFLVAHTEKMKHDIDSAKHDRQIKIAALRLEYFRAGMPFNEDQFV
jgi:hypothetical protein